MLDMQHGFPSSDAVLIRTFDEYLALKYATWHVSSRSPVTNSRSDRLRRQMPLSAHQRFVERPQRRARVESSPAKVGASDRR